MTLLVGIFLGISLLALVWGILYVLTAIWTPLLRASGAGHIVLVVNNLAPIAMGAFTIWFQTWYPAHLASNGSSGREQA